MEKQREIKLAGFGGQGIVLAGFILGRAASLHDGRQATLAQSYGPESRGGACSAEVVISETSIDYPRVTQPEVLVVMSQEAYHTYASKRPSDCLLIIDEDLVELPLQEGDARVLRVPATRLAEQLGRKIVANMVMLGFLTGAVEMVSVEAMRQAITDSVPKGTEGLNLKAFQAGYDHARELETNHRGRESELALEGVGA